MKIGDIVRVTKIPADLPPGDVPLQTLFRGCLGKTFPIVAFDDDLIELHVGEAFGEAPERHRIWVDAQHVKLQQA
jgi:hypothetical protein